MRSAAQLYNFFSATFVDQCTILSKRSASTIRPLEYLLYNSYITYILCISCNFERFLISQWKKSCPLRTACPASAVTPTGRKRRNSTTLPSPAAPREWTPRGPGRGRGRAAGAAARSCWTTVLPKSCAWCAAIGRPVTITTRSRAKDAKASSGGASPKMPCTSASTATTARSTCTCGASVKSVGWKNAWPSAWGPNVSSLLYHVWLQIFSEKRRIRKIVSEFGRNPTVENQLCLTCSAAWGGSDHIFTIPSFYIKPLFKHVLVYTKKNVYIL